MTDQRVVDVVRAVGRETDAPQELVEAVLRGALPSIRLVGQSPREGEAPRLGGCRIGGLPDLPEGVRWPRLSAARKSDHSRPQREDEPLWFLMQVNLTEVAPADAANLLPTAGMLYFFFHWHPADEPQAPDAGLVLFHNGGEQGLRRVEAPPDMHSGGHFRGFDLIPRLEWTIPNCDDTNYQLDFWNNLHSRVAVAQGLEDPWGPVPIHRMLGYPELLQADGLPEGYVLLLQVSSDYPVGMQWGDCGRIHYIIGDADLKAQNFGETEAFLEDQ
jgi:hypothetical protein